MREERRSLVPLGTRSLMALLGVLTAVLVLQGIWFVLHQSREDPIDDSGSIAVPTKRPVMMAGTSAAEGVLAAEAAATTIVTRDFRDYDAQVAQAVGLMTPALAANYRKVSASARPSFERDQIRVVARAVGSGVVRANTTELEALVLLDQRTSRKGKEPTTENTRALVTLVHTDDGWLVDDIETN